VLTGAASETSPDDFKWELYNIDKDFTESKDLAASNPQKLKELQAIFDQEAKKFGVYPLDSTAAARLHPAIRPSLTRGRTSFVYYPGMTRISEGTAPNTKNTSYSITADVNLPDKKASGILVTIGGHFGGWVLMVTTGNQSLPMPSRTSQSTKPVLFRIRLCLPANTPSVLILPMMGVVVVKGVWEPCSLTIKKSPKAALRVHYPIVCPWMRLWMWGNV
ncbi:MAG: hypothetical protein ACKO43_04250, partial [Alphaproteobacteria bacterium]